MTAAPSPSQPNAEPVRHTKTPWTLRQFDHSVTLYGPGKIQVMSTSWHSSIRSSYPLKPESLANAAFVLEAVNSHDALVKALIQARLRIEYLGAACNDPRHFEANTSTFLPAIDAALSAAGNGEVGK